MILGNDGAGTPGDGTLVGTYPVLGSDDWREDDTLDPNWHIFSEFLPGDFCGLHCCAKAQCRFSTQPPIGTPRLGARHGLTYRFRALFTKSALQPGQTLLVQGSSGGMSTALIQLGRAAGFELWATSRTDQGRALAEKLGAHPTFESNEKLPRKVQAVVCVLDAVANYRQSTGP